jgi:hypothetical protein
LKDYAHSYLMEFAKRDFINSSAIQLIWNDFVKRKKTVNYARIWSIVSLEHWMQKHSL